MPKVDEYEIILGTFNDNEFTWHHVDNYKDIKKAYKAFKDYVQSQLKYTDEELKKVWNTGRLDIELRKGNRLLNWVGVYSREAEKLIDEEEKEKDEKKSTKAKDSMPVSRSAKKKLLDAWDDGDRDNLVVCRYCKDAIESHEGRQQWITHLIDEDTENKLCDWCGEESPDGYLYEIL